MTHIVRPLVLALVIGTAGCAEPAPNASPAGASAAAAAWASLTPTANGSIRPDLTVGQARDPNGASLAGASAAAEGRPSLSPTANGSIRPDLNAGQARDPNPRPVGDGGPSRLEVDEGRGAVGVGESARGYSTGASAGPPSLDTLAFSCIEHEGAPFVDVLVGHDPASRVDTVELAMVDDQGALELHPMYVTSEGFELPLEQIPARSYAPGRTTHLRDGDGGCGEGWTVRATGYDVYGRALGCLQIDLGEPRLALPARDCAGS
ncbi:MAG: hypothetical protein ACI9K2_005417 [Myxococcota bacterium]|jgi:hypothetical protein